MSRFSPKFKIPRLYPILDATLLHQAAIPIEIFARELRKAGIHLLQYRDKDSSDQLMLERALLLRHIFPATEHCLILNDRVSLIQPSGSDGIHVGQDDLSPLAVRAAAENSFLGVSTHNEEQLRIAANGPADYLAIGPVFATSSKHAAGPVVGLEGVLLARRLTTKPLVAIGGITRANCVSVMDAGADSVAVISDLVTPHGASTAQRVEEFLAILA